MSEVAQTTTVAAATPQAPTAPAPSGQIESAGSTSAATPSPIVVPATLAEAKRSLYGQQAPSGQTVADAKAAVVGTAPEPTTDVQRARDELGRFTPSAATEAAAEPTSSAEPVTATTESVAPLDAPAATDAVPEGYVKLDLPEGHPLRDRGHTHSIVPAAQEEYHRWAINNAVRNNQLQEAQRHRREAEDALIRMNAELAARQEFALEALKNPALSQHIAEIRAEWGDEAAERYVAGLMAEQQGNIQQRVQAELQRVNAAAVNRQATEFVDGAIRASLQRYNHWTEGEIRRAVAAYGSTLAAEGRDNATLDDFLDFADVLYVRNPVVRDELSRYKTETQRATEERQRQEAAEAERRRLQDAATRAAEVPFAGIPATLHAGRTMPAAVGPANVRDARRALTGKSNF